MYKKKLQNKATCMRPLPISFLTTTALCLPHFILGRPLMHKGHVQIHLPCYLSNPAFLPHRPPSFFMPAYLSPICSSFAIFIAVIKFAVPTLRLRHETRSPKLTGDPNSNNDNLWLDIGLSAVFVVFSVLLLVFSFVRPEEKGLQVILSLIEGSFIVYQVCCLVTLKAILTFSLRADIYPFTIQTGYLCRFGRARGGFGGFD
jgi:hypothetical protein